jgi:hypothetical protein
MSPEQFWDGDAWLFAAYREAQRRTGERESWDRWLAGMYVYDALLRAAPALNAMSKSHRARSWPERPYDLPEQEREETPQERERAAHERMREWMLSHGPSK